MASTYSELTHLEYTGAVDNSGNVVRAQFNFQGYNRGASNLTAGRTWSVSMSNSDGPMCFIATNNQEVSGVTTEILTSGTESGTTTGTLEMYPLTAGTTYRLQAYTEGGTPEVDITFTPELNNNPRVKDLASGTLAESISASTTTLLVYVGDGSVSTLKAVWPDTPFYATLMPASPSAGVPNNLDSEIVKVTAVGNDQIGNTTLTVVRGQKGTTTKAFSEGDVVTNAVYAGDAVLLSEEGTSEAEIPWVGTDDIKDRAVKVGKIDWDTIIPQNTGTTYELPMKYKGKTIYARRFAGTFNLSGTTRAQITLLASETSAKIVKTIGWFGPFAGSANAEVNQTFGADGINFSGYTQVVASSSAGICLRAMYNTTSTGAYYDTVVYWIRDN